MEEEQQEELQLQLKKLGTDNWTYALGAQEPNYGEHPKLQEGDGPKGWAYVPDDTEKKMTRRPEGYPRDTLEYFMRLRCLSVEGNKTDLIVRIKKFREDFETSKPIKVADVPITLDNLQSISYNALAKEVKRLGIRIKTRKKGGRPAKPILQEALQKYLEDDTESTEDEHLAGVGEGGGKPNEKAGEGEGGGKQDGTGTTEDEHLAGVGEGGGKPNEKAGEGEGGGKQDGMESTEDQHLAGVGEGGGKPNEKAGEGEGGGKQDGMETTEDQHLAGVGEGGGKPNEKAGNKRKPQGGANEGIKRMRQGEEMQEGVEGEEKGDTKEDGVSAGGWCAAGKELCTLYKQFKESGVALPPLNSQKLCPGCQRYIHGPCGFEEDGGDVCWCLPCSGRGGRATATGGGASNSGRGGRATATGGASTSFGRKCREKIFDSDSDHDSLSDYDSETGCGVQLLDFENKFGWVPNRIDLTIPCPEPGCGVSICGGTSKRVVLKSEMVRLYASLRDKRIKGKGDGRGLTKIEQLFDQTKTSNVITKAVLRGGGKRKKENKMVHTLVPGVDDRWVDYMIMMGRQKSNNPLLLIKKHYKEHHGGVRLPAMCFQKKISYTEHLKQWNRSHGEAESIDERKFGQFYRRVCRVSEIRSFKYKSMGDAETAATWDLAFATYVRRMKRFEGTGNRRAGEVEEEVRVEKV